MKLQVFWPNSQASLSILTIHQLRMKRLALYLYFQAIAQGHVRQRVTRCKLGLV